MNEFVMRIIASAIGATAGAIIGNCLSRPLIAALDRFFGYCDKKGWFRE